tara:strand:- start:430 stop:714 length:285 start_codon:yes stop_codon:yes gene_type:complete
MLLEADQSGYYRKIKEGAPVLAFMKATYSAMHSAPLIQLPPEILEMIYMYCTLGTLQVDEMRKLYVAGLLLGMAGVNDRDIVHGALVASLPCIF